MGRTRRVLRRGGKLFGLFVVVAVLTPVAAAATVFGSLLFLDLPPTLPDETNPTEASEVTRVYDAFGNEVETFRSFETSLPVQRGDIPEVLKDAVVAAEDRNFYNHSGVDVGAALRALWVDLRSGEVVQGGSTITQQYVKNAYTGGERTVTRKVREAVLASQLDRQISKDEILYRYLSDTYFGEGAYGVGAAAATYFRKPVNELTLSESALLAGLIPAPSRYSPRVDPFGAEDRRLGVLDAMLEEEMISEAEHTLAVAQPVWLAELGEPAGPVTTVLPPEPQTANHPWFKDYVRRYVDERLGGDDLYRGLRIETTLDPRVQAAAVASVAEALEGTEEVQMAVVAVEPPTGYVRAIVGGRDFADSSVNRALGAAGGGTDRQPGSSFKPFVLAHAFEQGIGPDATYSGAPHEVAGTTIGNYGGSSYGTIDLRSATPRSVNTVFTRLILDVGVESTFETVNRLGIDTPPYDPGRFGASVALGALGASPLEMASAYGVFAANGRRAGPTPVLRVLDSEGNVLIDNTRPATVPVLDPAVATNVTDVLQGVLESGGTASGRGLVRPAGGKTGTSQEARDAWFEGYTPTLSTSVWVGYDQPESLRGIGGFDELTGGSLPPRTWQRFMEEALDGVPVTDFDEPAPIRPPVEPEEREAREGFAVGTRRRPERTPGGGGFTESMGGPSAEASPPPTSPTTTAPSSPRSARPSSPTTTAPSPTTTAPSPTTTAPSPTTPAPPPATSTTEPSGDGSGPSDPEG